MWFCILDIPDPVQAAAERQAVAVAGDPHGGLHGARLGQRGRGQLSRPGDPRHGGQHQQPMFPDWTYVIYVI